MPVTLFVKPLQSTYKFWLHFVLAQMYFCLKKSGSNDSIIYKER